MKDFNYYLERTSIINKLRDVFNRVVSKFKSGEIDEADLKKRYDQAKEVIPNVENVVANIMKNNSDHLADLLIQARFGTEYKEAFSFKKLASRVKKGFVPSATFYPTLKLFEQFTQVIGGEKAIKDISLNVGMEEIPIILGACFTYLFFKTLKEIYLLKKDEEKEKEKYAQYKEKTYERIHKVVDPTTQKMQEKLWSKEKMDEWLKKELWSKRELNNFVKKIVNKELIAKEG